MLMQRDASISNAEPKPRSTFVLFSGPTLPVVPLEPRKSIPGPMSLYTLDGTTRQLLRLERFGQEDFSVRSFIEKLSGAQRHLDDDQRLDPKPYIRTFECAATELERLHEIALSQEEAASLTAARLSESRNAEIQELVTNVNECVKEVKALDEVSTEISQLTGPVGQNLERISHQHSQISDYRALISAYMSFLDEKQPSELSRLWQTDVRRLASFVSQLQKLATAIGPLEGKPDVEKQVDKYAENLENQLLSNFLESYQNFDLPGMRDTADILFEFNGGGSVVQAYINQHRFFMNVDQLQQPEEESTQSEALWQQLRTPGSKFSDFVKLIQRNVDEIAETIARETEIITKVFSRPALVLSMFIQRTFAQKIQGFITSYMEEAADQRNILPQVRVLGVCYMKVNELVTSLQKIWSNSSSGLSDSEQTELGAVLESNFMDAFLLYIDDYLALEEKSLLEIIEQELGPSTVASKGSAIKRSTSTLTTNSSTEDGRMERLRRAMRNLRYDDGGNTEDGTEAVNNMGSATGADVDASPQTSLGVSRNSGATLGNEAPGSPKTPGSATSQSRYFSKEVTVTNLHNVLAAFGEAISREQLLRQPQNFASDTTILYNLLTREVGGRYINAEIDNALSLSYKIDTRSGIDWSFIESVKISGHGLRLLSAFIKTVFFAMVQAAPDTQQNMADALNMYITNVQRSCRELIEQVADLMHLRTKHLFSKNTKRDFLDPVSEDGILSPEIYEELVHLASQAKEHLSHDNSHRLLNLVAINFCDDLLNHIPSFTISVSGGLALSNDIAEYERLMTQDWGLSGELADKFATLRAISRLYTADPSLLSSLLRDSHLSKLTSNQLRLYLSQRSDNNAKMMSILYFHNSLQYKSWY